VRRERGDMIETYKIMTGKENIDRNQFFHLADSKYILRGHDMKIEKARFRQEILFQSESGQRLEPTAKGCGGSQDRQRIQECLGQSKTQNGRYKLLKLSGPSSTK